MGEHTFPSGDFDTDDGYATTRACDLAEGLLDALSRPAHNWRAIDAESGELHELSAAMAARYGADGKGLAR